MKQVLRSLKPLVFPFIGSAFPRTQRARPKSRSVRASFDPTARALILNRPRSGLIWSDLVGFGLICSVVIGFGLICSVVIGFGLIHLDPLCSPPLPLLP